MGYVTFNRSKYGHHLSPYECLFCIELPPIHEKASLAWLFPCLRRFCPSGFAELFFVLACAMFLLYPNRTNEEQMKILAAIFFTFSCLTAGLPGDFLLQTLSVSLTDRTCGGCCSHVVFSFYSFLNLSWTLNNHKTHCAFPLPVYIIKRAQRPQRQSNRHWDVVTLSEHKVRTHGVWKELLEWRNPVLPLLLFYTARLLYY